MVYFAVLAAVVALGVPIAVLSAAYAQSKVGMAGLEGIARQPEAAGSILINMALALGFIESLVLYCLIIFFVLQGKLPATEKILELIK